MADPASPPSSDSLSLPAASPHSTAQGTPPPGSPAFAPYTPRSSLGRPSSGRSALGAPSSPVPPLPGPGPQTAAARSRLSGSASPGPPPAGPLQTPAQTGGAASAAGAPFTGLSGLARLAGFSSDSRPGSPVDSEEGQPTLSAGGHSLQTSVWTEDRSHDMHSYSERSGRSSWRFDAASTTFAMARTQRISANPPLPDKPYQAPPVPVPPLSPNTAAAAASAAGATGRSSLGRKRAAQAREMERALALDLESSPTPSGAASAVDSDEARRPSTSSTRGTGSTDMPPIPPKDFPRYPFLAQDPALLRSESPQNVAFGAFAGTYAGLNRPNSGASAAASEPAPAVRSKHLSAQSTYSEIESVDGHRRSSRAWGLFAGGPAPAWGRRDSQRSVKSAKSTVSSRSRSKRRSAKRASLAASMAGRMLGTGNDLDEWEDENEQDADLFMLVRRAAILERLLRAGKRASGQNGSKRFSTFSTSTRYSSRVGHYRYGGGGGGAGGSQSPVPPSSSTSHNRRSAQSTKTNSIRARLVRKFHRERAFAGLGSEAGDDSPPPLPPRSLDHGYDPSNDNEIDLASSDYHDSNNSHNLRAERASTPPRRPLTSFSRQAERPPTPPGAGAGVIVFPELAALAPLDPFKRNGDVCAQSCLPPSTAVPSTPLPPPPPAFTSSRASPALGRTGFTSRSLHSIRNLRWVDEKGGTGSSSGFSPTRASKTPTVLWGDVPTCNEQFNARAARRTKIIISIACVVGIILIVGLLAGLLGARHAQLAKAAAG